MGGSDVTMDPKLARKDNAGRYQSIATLMQSAQSDKRQRMAASISEAPSAAYSQIADPDLQARR